ncbi:unnamed protein product [Pleuronectes platessa]|uniref:Uncharacterized protein n=1 Tax=Pleuronectes platessa TaxID=8262 RepID=A0A9N7USW6_PLEPL|nr:unnamed protein product [Pleuronectes platessa]
MATGGHASGIWWNEFGDDARHLYDRDTNLVKLMTGHSNHDSIDHRHKSKAGATWPLTAVLSHRSFVEHSEDILRKGTGYRNWSEKHILKCKLREALLEESDGE